MLENIGLGGGCHWCTEAIFLSLKGVKELKQGWIASLEENASFSEAVWVYYDPRQIDLKTLIHVHLCTHSSTSNHSMRKKYRSAVYTFDDQQHNQAAHILGELQKEFDRPIVTQVLPFTSFKENIEVYKDYYYKDTSKPFCQVNIDPKLRILLAQFKEVVKTEKLHHLDK